MQTLQALQRRIQNATDMQSVVRTMKTLAAVNIRHYEAAVTSLADYHAAVRTAFRVLFRDRPVPRASGGSVRGARFGAILFGSDQGLCGQFNEDMARYAMERMRGSEADGAEWSILAIGQRLAGRLLDAGYDLEPAPALPGSLGGIQELVWDLLPRIERWRQEADVLRVYVFHNQRTGASTYRERHVRLLPLNLRHLLRREEGEADFRTLPAHTMDWDGLFTDVVRQYLHVSLFRACAESLASENASRIASMQAAQKNIDERLEEFRGEYNQRRQESITEELLDVVSGFEALTQSDA